MCVVVSAWCGCVCVCSPVIIAKWCSMQSGPPLLQEVLPKAGLVYSEKGNLSEVLCKPKVMAIKSPSLEKLEEMEKMAMDYEVSVSAGAGSAAIILCCCLSCGRSSPLPLTQPDVV